MYTIFLFLLNYCIVSVRLRVSQQLFTNRSAYVSYGFGIGALIATWLALYPMLTKTLHLEQLQYTLSSVPFNGVTAGYIYGAIVLLGISLVITRRGGSTFRFLISYVGIALVVLLCYLLLWRLWVGISIVYFFVAASLEEAVKFTGSQLLTHSRTTFPTDSILFALIVALWFAFLENCVYLRSSVAWTPTTLQDIGTGLGMVLSRGSISFLIHGVFTGSIAFLITRLVPLSSWFKKWMVYAGAFLIGVVLHAGWNLLLFYQLQGLLIVSIVWCYFLLTYLLYQSESVYLKERLT